VLFPEWISDISRKDISWKWFCRHVSGCKVKEWDTFAREPHVRITLYNSATLALLFLYPVRVLVILLEEHE